MKGADASRAFFPQAELLLDVTRNSELFMNVALVYHFLIPGTRSAICRLPRHEPARSNRFRLFTSDQLMARHKVSLDIFWLRDKSLEDTDNPSPASSPTRPSRTWRPRRRGFGKLRRVLRLSTRLESIRAPSRCRVGKRRGEPPLRSMGEIESRTRLPPPSPKRSRSPISPGISRQHSEPRR
jgi:hypothetical protein